MPTREFYEKYLASSGYSPEDVAPIFDGYELTSLSAAALAILAGAEPPKGVQDLISPALDNVNRTTLDLLVDLHNQAKTKYGLTGAVFVGFYPTPLLTGKPYLQTKVL